jgi:hypothetical protein
MTRRAGERPRGTYRGGSNRWTADIRSCAIRLSRPHRHTPSAASHCWIRAGRSPVPAIRNVGCRAPPYRQPKISPQGVQRIVTGAGILSPIVTSGDARRTISAVRLGFGFVWVIAGCRAELADLACRAAARSGEGGAAPRRYIALDRHQLNRDVAGRLPTAFRLAVGLLPTGIVLPAAGPAVRSRAFCSRFLRIVAALPAPWHSLAIGVAGAARRPGQSPLAPWCAVVRRRCLS